MVKAFFHTLWNYSVASGLVNTQSNVSQKHKRAPKDLKHTFFKLTPAVLPSGNELQEGKSLFTSYKAYTYSDREKGHKVSDSKFQSCWFVKLECEEEQITSEIVVSEAFRVMMRSKELAPKSRVGVLDGKKYTLSKKIKNFKVWASLVSVEKIPDLRVQEHDPYARAELVNYYHMMAVSLLLGQHDLHSGNWGVVEEEGKKWAAVIDHGRSIVDGHIQRGEEILRWLNNPFSTAPLLTKEFVDALYAVAQEAEEKKLSLRKAFAEGLERAQLADLKGSSTITLDSLLYDLEHNISFLKKAAFFIEIQNAIFTLDLDVFQRLVYDEQFLELIEHWDVLCLRFNHGDPTDYFFRLITQDSDHDMTNSIWAHYLKNIIITNSQNRIYFKHQLDYYKAHHTLPSGKNEINEIYEITFSLEEKAVVEQEFESVIKRLKPFRDAYLDTMNFREEVLSNTIGGFF